jgi:hypothetical protein
MGGTLRLEPMKMRERFDGWYVEERAYLLTINRSQGSFLLMVKRSE